MKDQSFVARIVSALTDRGFVIWADNISTDVDGIRVGELWKQSLANAINESSAILFILSENSVTSPWVRSEIERAEQTGKPILPAQIGELTSETSKLLDTGFRLGGHRVFDVQISKFHKSDFASVLTKLSRDLASVVRVETPDLNFLPGKNYQQLVGRDQ